MAFPRSNEPSLLQTALASAAMARLLVYFAVHPDEPLHVRELHRRTGLAMASLQNELGRLHRLGLLLRERKGRRLVYRLDLGSPRWPAFHALLRQLARPAEVLREVFTGVPGVEAAFVFGSEARGDTRPDSDVDLFLIADEDIHAAVGDSLTDAESLLGRDIDVITYTPARAAARANQSVFLRRVLQEPKQWVAGDARRLSLLRASA